MANTGTCPIPYLLTRFANGTGAPLSMNSSLFAFSKTTSTFIGTTQGCLHPSSPASARPLGRVGRGRRDVLDFSYAQAHPRKRADDCLRPLPRSLCPVASGRPDAYVEAGYPPVLHVVCHLGGRLHCRIGLAFVPVSLDYHAA